MSDDMTNLLFLILGIIIGSIIGILCDSLASYQRRLKRFRKELKRLYEWQTNIEESADQKTDCSGEEL